MRTKTDYMKRDERRSGMGYRSDGAIWLPEKTFKRLPEKLVENLAENWKKEDDDVYSFTGWKWYSPNYDDIKMWEDFMAGKLTTGNIPIEYDFVRLGEEYEDIEIATGDKFGVNRTWEVY